MSVFTKVLRAGEGKKVRRLAELVPLVGNLEPEMQGLSDDALAHKTVEFKERLDAGETLDDLLIEAFAVVREAAWRVIGQRRKCLRLVGLQRPGAVGRPPGVGCARAACGSVVESRCQSQAKRPT